MNRTELISRLTTDIEHAEEYNMPLDDISWMGNYGCLVTINEAKLFLELLERENNDPVENTKESLRSLTTSLESLMQKLTASIEDSDTEEYPDIEEKVRIAWWAFTKNLDYEKLKNSDNLYDKQDWVNDVWELVESIRQNGAKWFLGKYEEYFD